MEPSSADPAAEPSTSHPAARAPTRRRAGNAIKKVTPHAIMRT